MIFNRKKPSETATVGFQTTFCLFGCVGCFFFLSGEYIALSISIALSVQTVILNKLSVSPHEISAVFFIFRTMRVPRIIAFAAIAQIQFAAFDIAFYLAAAARTVRTAFIPLSGNNVFW